MNAPGIRPRRLLPALTSALLALGLAACSHSPSKPAAANAPTTTSPVTRTTVPPPPPVYPLTGLPVTNPAFAVRPALSVKVENAPGARPQAGLNQADIVTEELVEGGITRFLATFQSHNAALVGPVRSARPVDGDLLRELGGGLFAYSGAAAGEIAPVIAYSTSVLVGAFQAPQAYFRVGYRSAPHNLFTSTPALYSAARAMHADRGPPPQLFEYSTTPPPGAAKVTSVDVPMSPFTPVRWTWSPGANAYFRWEQGTPMLLIDGSQVSAANVVILRVRITYEPGLVDSIGNPDPIPVVIGSGDLWVLRNGQMIRGTWSRPTRNDRVRLVGPGGATIPLQPGRTWIELLPYPALPSPSK